MSGATSKSTEVPSWVLWVGLACLAAGVPHGAVDHTFALPVAHRARALMLYVATAAVASVVILLVPGPSFVVVIAMSAWHFGSGDVESLADLGHDVPDARVWSALHKLAAGAVPLVLPLTGSATSATLEVIQPRLTALDGLATGGVRLATVALALVVVARLVSTRRIRSAAELVVLVALGILVSPLLAFGVYFAAWHSLRHTARLAQGEDGTVLAGRLARTVLAGLPALALVAIAVAVVLLTVGGFSGPGRWLWVTLAMVWGLTVPHMVVVARFDAAQRSARRSSGADVRGRLTLFTNP
jgi:Brp/Blh family beta-carotene 15,15'-monooxygenase